VLTAKPPAAISDSQLVTTNWLRSSKLVHDWRSVSQYVLVSSALVGLASRYYFLSECCCLKFAVLFLWGRPLWWRTGLQFAVQSLNGPSRAEPLTILYCLIWYSPNLESRESKVEVTLRLTGSQSIGQSVCFGIEYPCGTCIQILLPVGMLLYSNEAKRMLFVSNFMLKLLVN
jgi:hypothetical protein